MKKKVMLLSLGMLCAPVLGAADQSYWEKAQSLFSRYVQGTNPVEKRALIDAVQATGKGIQGLVDPNAVAAGVDRATQELAAVASVGAAANAVATTGVGAAESAVNTVASTVGNGVRAAHMVGRGIQATVDSGSVAAGVNFGAKQLATVAVTTARAVDAVATTGIGAAKSAVDTFASTVSNGVRAGQAVGRGIQATVNSDAIATGVNQATEQLTTVAAATRTVDAVASVGEGAIAAGVGRATQELAAVASVGAAANAVATTGVGAAESAVDTFASTVSNGVRAGQAVGGGIQATVNSDAIATGVNRATKQLASVAKHQASLWGKFGGFCSNARSALAGYATVARNGLATAAASARAFGATEFDRLKRVTRSGIAGTRTGVAAGWNRTTAAVANAKTYGSAKCAQLKDATRAGIAGAKTQMNAGWSRAAMAVANAKVKAARVKSSVSVGATNAYGTMRGVAVNTAIGTKQWLRAANVPADQRTRVMATRIGGIALGTAALGYAAYKAYGLWGNKQPRALTQKERKKLFDEQAQELFRTRPA